MGVGLSTSGTRLRWRGGVGGICTCSTIKKRFPSSPSLTIDSPVPTGRGGFSGDEWVEERIKMANFERVGDNGAGSSSAGLGVYVEWTGL